MFREDSLRSILGIQGWNIKNVRSTLDELTIEIIRDRCHVYICPICKEGSLIYYDKVGIRCARDFGMIGKRCYLEFESIRIYCKNCNKVLTEFLS